MLYTQAVPNPPAGHDWAWTVPGNYIYDVTAIVATLTTGTTNPPTAVDSSGNGNNGTYVRAGAQNTTFGPSLIGGTDPSYDGHTSNGHVTIPASGNTWATDWSVAFWLQYGPGTVNGATVHPFTISDTVDSDGITLQVIRGGNMTLYGGFPASAPFPNDTAAHHVAVTWHVTAYAANLVHFTAVFYVDGAQVGTGSDTFIVTAPDQPFSSYVMWKGNLADPQAYMDEYATFATALSAGQVSGLYAASGSLAAYSAAVLALSPTNYYHLDDGGNGTGRQVALTVDSGGIALQSIPTGFAEVAITGPFVYSWQTGLQSSTQTAGGLLTTVAIPQLIIPGGFVIGTDTLDIASGDQWSAITIWWNSDVMDAKSLESPYAYPPGAFLVYEQVKGP